MPASTIHSSSTASFSHSKREGEIEINTEKTPMPTHLQNLEYINTLSVPGQSKYGSSRIAVTQDYSFTTEGGAAIADPSYSTENYGNIGSFHDPK